MDEDVHTPLVGSCQVSSYAETGEDDKASHSAEYMIRKPKRKVIVEPVLAVLALCGFTIQMTASLYTYHRFQEQAADDLGLNISTLDLSQLMKHCSLNKSSEVYQLSHLAQQRNSYFNIMTGIASAIPNLVAVIFLGPYSDKAGRRYAIVIPLTGTLLYTVVCLLVIKFQLPLWYLFVGSFLDGLGGRYIVLLVGCFAYIADITPKENRQFRITIVELTMFLSAFVGPVVAGYWIQDANYFWPMTAGAAGLTLDLLYTIFFIPETVIKDPQAKFFTLNHLQKIADVYTNDEIPGRKWKLKLLYLAFIPIILPTLGDNVTTLFLQNPPLCWLSAKIGVYNAIYATVGIVGSVVFAKLAKFCIQSHTIALTSAFSSVIRNIYQALVMNDLMMYLLPALTIVMYLVIPTIRAMMSNLVHPSEQGAVFASIALSEVVFSFVGNLIFSTVYANTISILSGFVYFVMAAFYALGTAVLLTYVIWLKKEKKELEEVSDDFGKT